MLVAFFKVFFVKKQVRFSELDKGDVHAGRIGDVLPKLDLDRLRFKVCLRVDVKRLGLIFGLHNFRSHKLREVAAKPCANVVQLFDAELVVGLKPEVELGAVVAVIVIMLGGVVLDDFLAELVVLAFF